MVEDVEPGRVDLVIRMEVGVVLSGIVVDARGAPISEGNVSARGRIGSGWAQLERDGRFEIGGLRPGPYELLIADDEGFRGRPRKITAPATDLRLEVPDTAALRGRLLGADAESGWSVRAVDPKTGQPLVTGEERSYIVENIPWYVAAGTHIAFTLTIVLLQPLAVFTPAHYRKAV